MKVRDVKCLKPYHLTHQLINNVNGYVGSVTQRSVIKTSHVKFHWKLCAKVDINEFVL